MWLLADTMSERNRKVSIKLSSVCQISSIHLTNEFAGGRTDDMSTIPYLAWKANA
ncbi:MAG: hypothetical protein RLY66_34 [Candidatus Parcubacteria bacterium]|jgi:hypothetical protein